MIPLEVPIIIFNAFSAVYLYRRGEYGWSICGIAAIAAMVFSLVADHT